MSGALYFGPYTQRLRKMRDSLDDDTRDAALRCARKGEHTRAAQLEMGRCVTEILTSIKSNRELHRRAIADVLGVADATLYAWEQGKIHWLKLLDLLEFARRGHEDEVRKFCQIVERVCVFSAARAAMKCMEVLREYAREQVRIELSDEVYACVVRAAACDELWRARGKGSSASVKDVFSKLSAESCLNNGKLGWFEAAVDEWCPALLVYRDHFLFHD